MAVAVVIYVMKSSSWTLWVVILLLCQRRPTAGSVCQGRLPDHNFRGLALVHYISSDTEPNSRVSQSTLHIYHPLYIQYSLGYTSVITSFDPVLYILLNSFVYFNSFKHLIRFAMTVRVNLSCGLRCLESSGVYDREILPWDCFHRQLWAASAF